MLTPSLQIQHVSSFVFASTFEETEDISMTVATTVDMIMDIFLRHQLLFCSFNNGFPSFTSKDSTQNVCIRFKLLQTLKKDDNFFGFKSEEEYWHCY